MKVRDLREILQNPRIRQDAPILYDDGDVGMYQIRGFEILPKGAFMLKREESQPPPLVQSIGPAGIQVAQKVKDIIAGLWNPPTAKFLFQPTGEPDINITTVIKELKGFIEGVLLSTDK